MTNDEIYFALKELKTSDKEIAEYIADKGKVTQAVRTLHVCINNGSHLCEPHGKVKNVLYGLFARHAKELLKEKINNVKKVLEFCKCL